jgi:hypothetical protein
MSVTFLAAGLHNLTFVAGVPVIPVVCQDYYHLFDGKTRFKSGNLRIKGNTVEITL